MPADQQGLFVSLRLSASKLLLVSGGLLGGLAIGREGPSVQIAAGVMQHAQRWLPRPGAWMDTFKQFLAFPMYAAVVWLLWVLAQQAGPDGVALALGGLVLIAFALPKPG